MKVIWRPLLLVPAIGLGYLGLAGAALASDYSHDCRSSDGQWQMWDEGLSASSDSNQTQIPYTTVKDTVLSRREGYCLSRGQKFGFAAKTYVRRIKFKHDGQNYEIDMLCEMASDGLPAAFSCEKEVVTIDTQQSSGGGDGGGGGQYESGEYEDEAPAPSSTALWSHNGSLMRLDANGKARTFSYENPRPGMRKAGAKPGDVVFEGLRDGQRYYGTAYIYSKSCGRHGYAVEGRVMAGDRGVILEGEAPRFDDACNITSTRRDVLRFDYVRR